MTATNLTSEESLQQLLAGEIHVSDLPDAVALKLIALIRLVHDNLEDGLKEIPLPAADDAGAAKTYLKNIADALATQPATQQAEAQHISGETHREAAEQRHGFKKFLGALVEFATPENRARVRTRLEKALTPFHFDDTKAAALVEQLAKYPYFYTSDDGSPIFDFHTKITGIVTRIAQRRGFKKGSIEETKLLDDYVQAAMKRPQLFYQDPDTIFSKISTIMDYAARLRADGHIFPKPLPREQKAGLEGDRLLVRRLLNRPALLTSASDALWLGFTHATVKYGGETKAEIPMYAMVNTRGTIETRLVTLLGGEPGPTPKNHPDTMEGKWSKAQAKNFLLRALAHEEMFYKPKKGTPTTWVEKESDPTPPTTQR